MRSEETIIDESATGPSIPISPTLDEMTGGHRQTPALIDGRVLAISAAAILVAFGSCLVAKALVSLIDLVTNITFFGMLSFQHRTLANIHPSVWTVIAPIGGGLIVGAMAKYGSAAIRGHGIPEAMEQILTNESKIPPRLTILKPLSSAIAIGTGGPFGAEGPIIATGGAMGSLLGQLLHITAGERKTLLAAGAAAGMTAIFGSPVAAVLLAVELLLFEFRTRSLIPVALACSTAAGVRLLLFPAGPMFDMASMRPPTDTALLVYLLIGAAVGVIAVLVTKLVYAIEDTFDRLPIHWAWWPALGGIAVGVIGYFAPRTLGVGYDNITDLLSGSLVGTALISLTLLKLASWSVALGSGTSGGTLAPLLTIGGGLGSLMGLGLQHVAPGLGVDPRVAALVGMAAMFSGASRALLTSVVFAFEVTQQPAGIAPLLGGCTAAYLISCVFLRQTIMTEKIFRRGITVPSEYSSDFLAGVSAATIGRKEVTTIHAMDSVGKVQEWLHSRTKHVMHHGFPVLDPQGRLIGVVTRAEILDAEPTELIRSVVSRPPVTVFEDQTAREAADIMVREQVGRLPVLTRERGELVGMITRSDLLQAHVRRLNEEESSERHIVLGRNSKTAGS